MQIAPETTTTEVETKPVRKPRTKKVKPTEPETATTVDAGHVEESPETALPATQTPEMVESINLFAEDAPRAIVGDSVTLDPREPQLVGINHYPDHYVEALETWKKGIDRAEEAVKEAEAEWKEAKSTASEAKKEYDSAVLSLRRAVSAEPEKMPLFDGPSRATPAPSPVATDDRWRAWKLEDVEDLPGGSLAAFDAANLITMGDLVDWQGKGNRLEDLPGIGDVKAEKIAECLVATHAVRPWDQPIVAEAVVDESGDEDVEFDDEDEDFEGVEEDGIDDDE